MKLHQFVIVISLVLGLQSTEVHGIEIKGPIYVQFVCYTHTGYDVNNFNHDFAKLRGPIASDSVCADVLTGSGREVEFPHGNGVSTHLSPLDCVKAVPEG